MNDKEKIKAIFSSAYELKKLMLELGDWNLNLMHTIHEVISCYRNDGKVLFFGNGGSAADAQHIAAELSGRFKLNRPALHAEALHTNTSYLTAVANDYGYKEVYARLIEGIAKPGDVVIGLSTSGNSENIIEGLTMAKSLKNVKTIGWTGQDGGKMKNWCEICVQVPSSDTARIQELHMLFGHILCEMVEVEMFGKK